MARAAHPVGGTSPARYTAGDKAEAARHGICAAVERGHTPLLASVTGSALRGLDHAGSDLDVLVAVADALPRPVADVTEELDLTFAPLPHILGKVGESVPYTEWAASPYLVPHGALGEAWLPMVRAVRYNRYGLAAHAQSMARKTASRQPDPRKAARLVLAAYRFSHTAPGVAVQPRAVFDLCCGESPAAADWLQDSADVAGAVDTTEIAALRIERVASLLRGAVLSR